MGRFRPHVIFSAATTLDGKLATRTGDSKLSSKSDKNRVHKLRSTVDAILIGKNTAKLDDPILSVHHDKKKNPIRIILDSNATIKNSSRILRTSSKIPTIIVVGERASKNNLQRLEKLPIQIIVCGKDRINVKKLLVTLRKQGLKKILVEGGGEINWSFVKENLIDEAIITVTPYLVGGVVATTLVDGKGFSTITKSAKLKLKSARRMNNEIVLHYEN